MPYWNVEITDNTRPILLIAGPATIVSDELLQRHSHDSRIIYLSSDATQSNLDDENIAVLSKESFYYVDRLTQKVDYALFFVDSYTKTISTGVQQLLEKGETKIVFVIPDDLWEIFPSLLPYDLPEQCIVILLGHILRFEKHPTHAIDTLLFSALVFSRVPLNQTEDPFSSIGLEDAIKEIERCLYEYQRSREFIFLSYTHPTTFNAAVYILKNIDPDLSVEIADAHQSTKRIYGKNDVEYLIQNHYRTDLTEKRMHFVSTFEKEVTHIFDHHRSEARQTILPSFQQKKKREIHIRFSVPPFLFRSVMGGILGFFFIQIIILGIAFFFAQTGRSYIKNGNIQQGVSSFQNTEALLQWAHPLVSLVFLPLSRVSPSASVELALLPDGITTYESIRNLHFGIKGTDADETMFSKAIAQIQSFLFSLETNQKILNHSPLASFTNNSPLSYASILGISPDILGYKKDMTYLILFQNNAELRPTGGFIGSVGKIVFHKGKMTTFTIQDVYSIDGQLRVHIDPPYVIGRNLEPNLYLRDSNFDPNFEASATQAAQLYYDSTHTQIDGIIGVDFDVLKEMIHEIGPIRLDTYHITVTDTNIFSFLENTIQDNFFPGSTQKTTVLSELQTQIQLKLEQHPELLNKIAAIIPSLFKEKHVLFAFQDSSLQNVFSAEKLSDNNYDLREPTPNIPDILSVNEANIGANKVNLSISRNVHYTITIPEEGHLQSTVTETLNNTSPNLDYKAYIRIISPSGSSLQTISINGLTQHIVPAVTQPRVYSSKDFKPPIGFEVDQSDIHYHTIGFITTVPRDTSQTIVVTYTNGISVPIDTLLQYSLLYFKQPGTEPYSLVTTIYHPHDITAQNSKAVPSTDQIITKTIDSDTIENINFIKTSGS